jgi:hypothetical protein
VKPLTTHDQLERYFEQDCNPSPTSKVAETMRELLKLHPGRSFDELRQLARSGNVEGGSRV